jgi:Rrf2 family protein
MLTNTHFSIAVHVLVALAYNEGRVVSSDDLAKTVDTNPSFLRGLIGQLRDAGLVETRLGKGGGSVLARPAREISLAEVYRAVETSPGLPVHGCDRRSRCAVARNMHKVLADLETRLDGAVTAELEKTTVAGLVADYVSPSG